MSVHLLRHFVRDRAAICRWCYELHVLPYNNSSRTADHILMEYGVEVMPLEASPE
jgi:hypothetical protein